MTSKLASLLVQEGKLSARRMADVFQRQVIFGGTLDTILLEMGLLDEAVLLEYLGRAAAMAVAPEATAEALAPDAFEAVKRGFTALVAERFRAVPLGRAQGATKLRVMVIDPPEAQEIADLAEAIGVAIEPQVSLEYRFQEAQARLYGVPLPPRYATLLNKVRSRARAATPAAASPEPPAARHPETLNQFAPLGHKPAPRPSPTPASSASPAEAAAAQSARVAEVTKAAKAARAAASAPASSTPAARSPVKAAAEASSATSPTRERTTLVIRKNKLAAAGVYGAPDAAGPAANPPAAVRREATPVPTESDWELVRPPGDPEPEKPAAPSAPVAAQAAAPAGGGAVTPTAPARREPVAAPAPLLSPPSAAAAPIAPAATKPAAVPAATSNPAPVASVTPAPVKPAPATPAPIAFAPIAPAPIAPAAPAPITPTPASLAPATPLPLAEGLAAMHLATDRDAVLEILCRIARDRFVFVAVFSVQGDTAAARLALGDTWHERAELAAAGVDLTVPSSLRTVVQSCAPLLGRVGEGGLGDALRTMGRPAPLPAALVPVALRERAIAVLYADDGGRAIEGDELSLLAQAAAEASSAFLRLIQAAKKKPAAAARDGATLTPSAVPRVAAAAATPVAATATPTHAASPSTADSAALVAQVERDDPAMEAAATTLLARGDEAARVVAARLPGPLRFGHRKLHTIVLPLVDHGPLVALAARFGAPIVPLLLPRLAEASPDVRFYLALVLSAIRSRDAIPALGQLLFDADAAVRRAAVAALCRYEPSTHLDALLEVLRGELLSPDLGRQRQAISAVGELRDVPSTPKLIDLLRHRDTEAVDLAERALVLITKQDFESSRWKWRSWWEKARAQSRIEWLVGGLDQPSLEARRSAAEELAAIGTDRFGFHEHFSPREREWAARRWAQWTREHPALHAELGQPQPAP